MKKRISVFAVALAVMLALGTCVYAAGGSRIADFLTHIGFSSQNDQFQNAAEDCIFQVDEQFTLGNVTYTLDEVIWQKGVLYGSGVMRAAEGSKALLIPEDYELSDHVGFTEHYGKEEEIPQTAPTYQEAAAALGINLTLPAITPDGCLLDGELIFGDIGFSYAPYGDGSIGFYFEIWGPSPVFDESNPNEHNEYPLLSGGIEKADGYTIQLDVRNWEITPDGVWLRGEEAAADTLLRETWTVDVKKQTAE